MEFRIVRCSRHFESKIQGGLRLLTKVAKLFGVEHFAQREFGSISFGDKRPFLDKRMRLSLANASSQETCHDDREAEVCGDPHDA